MGTAIKDLIDERKSTFMITIASANSVVDHFPKNLVFCGDLVSQLVVLMACLLKFLLEPGAILRELGLNMNQ